jgi:hypothetical protein
VVSLFDGRRAERFADLLDARSNGAPARSGDREMAGLVRTATVLSSSHQPAEATPDPMFTDRLRTRLLSVMEVQGIAQPTRSGSRAGRAFRVPRRVVIAGPALAGVLALSGVGAASSGAVPGDTLYGVKRSTESAQLSLASSDVNRGRLFLDFARTRMGEVTAVSADEAALLKTMDDMDEASRDGARLLGTAAVEGQDRAPLDAIDGFVLAQRSDLRDLVPSLDAVERNRALDSLVLLEQIQARSLDLRGSMLCTTGYADQGGADELGPLPQRCAALSAGTIPGVGGLPPVTSPSGTPFGALPSLVIPPGTPSLPGLGGTAPIGTGLPTPTLPGGGIPGLPGYQEGQGGPGGLLGTVTGTVGGVVGDLFGPLVGTEASPSPSADPSASPSASERSRLRDFFGGP